MRVDKLVMMGTATVAHLRDFVAELRAASIPAGRGGLYELDVSPVSLKSLCEDAEFDRSAQVRGSGLVRGVFAGGAIHAVLEVPEDAFPFVAGQAREAMPPPAAGRSR